MKELETIFTQFGWVVGVIALAGVIILGILKYCNVFKKFDESNRHYIYLAISVGLSVMGTIIFLAVTHTLTVATVFTIVGAVWALNQSAYNLFKITPINELAVKGLDWIKSLIKNLIDKKSENTKTEDNSKSKED